MHEPLLMQVLQGINDGKSRGLKLNLVEKRQLKLLHKVAHRAQFQKRINKIDLAACEHYVTIWQ